MEVITAAVVAEDALCNLAEVLAKNFPVAWRGPDADGYYDGPNGEVTQTPPEGSRHFPHHSRPRDIRDLSSGGVDASEAVDTFLQETSLNNTLQRKYSKDKVCGP
jgi:hypothetical protein